MWLCVRLCEWVSEKGTKEMSSQTDLLISHLKAGVRFRTKELGRWSHQERRRNVVERQDRKRKDGSETDNRMIQMIWNVVSWTHIYCRRSADEQGHVSEIDALSHSTQMLVAQLWHRKWLRLIDRGWWGSYPVQRTARLLLTESLLLSISLFHLSPRLPLTSPKALYHQHSLCF